MLTVLAATMLLALIPVVYQDPDATPDRSAVGSVIFAAINAAIALVAFRGRRNRAVLIAVAVAALAIGLLSLDGVVAMSTHSRAPWVELPMMWSASLADGAAAVTAVAAAIMRPAARFVSRSPSAT